MSDGAAYLLRGGLILTLEPAQPIVRGDLLIVDGRISALGVVPDAAVPAHASVLDVRDCVVLPGLVQAHVHLCQTLCRGAADDLPLLAWLRERLFPYESALAAADIQLAAQLGVAELLLSGTTTILDMGTVHHQDALCAAVAATGLRATVGKAMMDLPDTVPAGLLESTAQSLAESDALCQRWHGQANGRMRYAYAPRFALSCTEKLLREVGERVTSSGNKLATDDLSPAPRIHTHAAEQRDEVALVRARFGAGNIEALAGLGLRGDKVTLAHCVHVDESERRLLAQHGTYVAHCPSSNLKLGSGIAPVVELLAAGVGVALGADGAACNNRLDGFTELRLAALLQKGRLGSVALPAARALELATLGGARALGLQAEIGSLAPGKRADVTVVALTGAHVLPLHDPVSAVVYAVHATDVRHVLVDGRLLVKGGELTAATGLDVARLRALAGERVPGLMRRAGLA